ncbi:MAG TPA: tetratricopeptide repeat protein [Thermoanaerobaculia bacterium]|jgi:tetratricopeptide (TPR) repeat protein|nr:tetratricopeptide repeat protein [Thermoanaerobaculia bacterium]
MLHLFWTAVDRQCENVACEMRGRRVGRHVEFCEVCQRPLAPVKKVDWRAIAIAAGIAIALVIGFSYLTHLYLERRAAEHLSQATVYFQSKLQGATASDVDAVALAVQAERQLSDEQMKRVKEASKGLIAHLPRTLTVDVQHRMEFLVRDFYSDGRISSDEQVALDQFTQEQRLAPKAVEVFTNKIKGRLDDSYRSLAQGRSLAELGRYEEARAVYSRATQIDSGNALAWANLGAVYVHLGKTAEARSYYDKALSLDPENWLAHYNLGLLAAREGDRESAFQHLERALASLPPKANQERLEVIKDLMREPALEEMRDDPRFASLLSGTGGQGALP